MEKINMNRTKKFDEAINPHLEELKMLIDNQPDKVIRVKISDMTRIMGEEFSNMNYISLYTGLKLSFFKERILTNLGLHNDNSPILIMRKMRESEYQLPSYLKDDKITEVWVYDNKKAEERSKHLSELMKDLREDKERNKERKESLETQKWMEEIKKRRKEIEERIKKYDGGTIIALKPFETDNGFSKTKDIHTFTSVEKNGKIGIFLDDGFYPDSLFCDYLRNEDELYLFFDSVDIRSYPIDSQYRRESKTGYAEDACVYFDIEEIINDNPVTLNFSDGIWICNDWGNEDKYPEWELDTSASDRDDIIKEIKDYMEKENIILINKKGV